MSLGCMKDTFVNCFFCFFFPKSCFSSFVVVQVFDAVVLLGMYATGGVMVAYQHT